MRCTGCGLPRDESMRTGGDQDFDVTVLQCHACVTKATKANGWKGDLDGMYFAVHDRNEGASG